MMKTVHTGLHQQIAGENDEVKDDKADEDSTPSHCTLHKHIGTVDPGRYVASHRVNRRGAGDGWLTENGFSFLSHVQQSHVLSHFEVKKRWYHKLLYPPVTFFAGVPNDCCCWCQGHYLTLANKAGTIISSVNVAWATSSDRVRYFTWDLFLVWKTLLIVI